MPETSALLPRSEDASSREESGARSRVRRCGAGILALPAVAMMLFVALLRGKTIRPGSLRSLGWLAMSTEAPFSPEPWYIRDFRERYWSFNQTEAHTNLQWEGQCATVAQVNNSAFGWQADSGRSSTISKVTWAVGGNPDIAINWAITYLNGSVGADGEIYMHLGNCAWQDKVSINSGIEMHFVNASLRPTGDLSIEIFERLVGARLGDLSAYDEFLESSLGFLTDDLDAYAKRFDADGVRYLPLAWPGESDGATWYSLLMRVPTTSAVVEIIGPRYAGVGAGGAARSTNATRLFNANELAAKAASAGAALTAVKVSQPVVDIDGAAGWYADFLGAHTIADTSTAASDPLGGERRLALRLPGEDVIQLHLVKHPTPASAAAAAAATAAGFANFSFVSWREAVAVANADYVRGPAFGFTQWLDFHIGYSVEALLPYLALLDASAAPDGGGRAGGVTRYRLVADHCANYAYVAAPFGQTVQLIAGATGLDNRYITDFDLCAPTGGGPWMNAAHENFSQHQHHGFGMDDEMANGTAVRRR